jgi:hypothetical protein
VPESINLFSWGLLGRARWAKNQRIGSAVAGGLPRFFLILLHSFLIKEKRKARPARTKGKEKIKGGF